MVVHVLWLTSTFHYLSIAFNLNGTIILHNFIKINYEICYGKLYLNNLYNHHYKPLNLKWWFVNMAKIRRELIRCKWDNSMLWAPPWLEGIIVDERRWLVCFGCLSLSNVRNITSCFTLGNVGKHLTRKGAPSWFHNVSTSLLVTLESTWRGRVHQVGFIMFQPHSS